MLKSKQSAAKHSSHLFIHCAIIQDVDKILGPEQSIEITDRFVCTSDSIIYYIRYILRIKVYIGAKNQCYGLAKLGNIRR